MKTILTIGILLLTTTASASAAPNLPSGPMAQLKYYNERIDKLVHRKGPGDASDLSPADRSSVKSLVQDLIDFQELARLAMRQHWTQLSKPQQTEFVSAFKDMIERNYVKQLRGNVDYNIVYKNEAVRDDKATVATVVKVHTKGKSTDTTIDYKMRRAAEDKWLVFDIITDETSMLDNYRRQFDKILTNESYDALLQKIRKRSDEASSSK